jgi:hypothetical protein
MVDKAYFILHKASESAISKMKYAARQRAEQEHSWYNRFIILFKKLGLKF